MTFRGEDESLPKASLEHLLNKFWKWTGDLPAPKITHWTAQGTLAIIGSIPRKSTSVQWNGAHVGFDDYHPLWVVRNLSTGKYDQDFGFAISEIVPADLADWNNLGG